jgi:hypothetical protein
VILAERSDVPKCGMTSTAEKAGAALDLLPEEMREPAVAYLIEQAEKYRVLKALVAEGIDDVVAGHVSEWNFQDFLREARRPIARPSGA